MAAREVCQCLERSPGGASHIWHTHIDADHTYEVNFMMELVCHLLTIPSTRPFMQMTNTRLTF